MNHRAFRRILVWLVATAAASTVFAGGPLYIHDPASRVPNAWPAGTTSVYVDLGPLGVLGNDQADTMVAAAIGQWNDVPTSSFHGAIAGDLSAIGLPDIDASNVFDVLGPWNGGGIHFVYDADGSIHELLFGFSGVLGFTLIEYVDEDSPAILEATVVLNGSRIPDWTTVEEAAAQYAGVVTHEFGHAINLAHSQTNGQLYFFWEGYMGPEGCGDPYAQFPDASQLETMYPFIQLGQPSIEVSTVDFLDDVSTVSNLYPDAGWPQAYPTIRGTIRVPGHGPHTAEFTGANVIARNVADPFGDSISALSGDYSQGDAGPDGSYTFNGLTPGASYSLYVDGIWAGAFSTPFRTVLPGPEEYFNGTLESGNGITDDRCAASAIPVSAGSPYVADVTFNRVKGAPVFRPIELPNSSVADVSGDGGVVVGTWAGGLFRWTPEGDYELIGGSPYSPSPGISEDGQTIVGDIVDSTTWGQEVDVAAVWQGGTSWAPIGTVPGNTPCDFGLISAWDASNTGKVVGLSWRDCRETTAYEWTSGSGITELGFVGDSERPGSRADAVSADGSTIVGWDVDEFGFWRGARWDDGQESLIEVGQPAICANDPESPFYQWPYVGTAYGINADGSAIVGEGYPLERIIDFGGGDIYRYCDTGAWMWTEAGGVRWLGDFQYPDFNTTALDVSDDARIVTGIARPFFPWDPPRPMIWTETTGALDFQEFLELQGTWAPGWIVINAASLSGDGHTVAGGAFSPYSIQGYVVSMPKVVVCHDTPATKTKPGTKNTIDVAFPDSLADHLAHGDTIGLCGNGR